MVDSNPLTLASLELLRPYALLLLPIVLVGFWKDGGRGALQKAWVGSGGVTLLTRLRELTPRILLALSAVAMILALADVTRKYEVTHEVFATNRIFIDLDNSSSMYNFKYEPEPIYCPDREIKSRFPRIASACRATHEIIGSVEAYAKKKTGPDERIDKIAILRFARNSVVQVYPTSDFEKLHAEVDRMNWRDERMGVHTEIHLALLDMFNLALTRNFRGEAGNVPLTDDDRLLLYKAIAPEQKFGTPFYVPRSLEEKLIALRSDLRDTVFIIISDAQHGQFDQRLNADPASLIKMMQLAKYLELPVHVISILNDHAVVRKLAEETGHGPAKGPDRGGFHLLRSEQDFAHMDEIVRRILQSRFRPESKRSEARRISYSPRLALVGLVLLLVGVGLQSSRFGRTLVTGEQRGER